MARRTFDSFAALVAIGFLVWLASSIDVELAFGVSLILAIVLYMLCYLAPRLMTRIISAPRAFRLDENYGHKAFEMQVVSYASYHSAWLADVTHIGFFVEGLAWSVLAFQLGGVPALVGLVMLKVAQVRSYQDITFGRMLVLLWLIVVIAAGLIPSVSDSASLLAMGVLVVLPAWRVIGHVTEPVPPGVSGSGMFVPLEDNGLSATLGLSLVVGYVAEFASGIPFRLADVWAYDIATRAFGYGSDTLPSRSDIVHQRAMIFESGWAAAPSTAHLVTASSAGATTGVGV